jgi:glycosyltransferase involved in cell wall biosynthesis
VRSVDVVVPSYQNLAELRACLDSLGRQDYSDFRVLVCVDGSTDGTVEHLAAASTPFTLLTLTHPDGRNHGRAAARNLALPYLRAAVILLLDSDMRLARDGVRRHLEGLHESASVSIGDVVYLNRLENTWARYLTTRGKYKFAPGSGVGPLEFHGSNTALRTEDLLAVGGFDPTLDAYGGEDTDLALRLANERGATFVYNTAARAETVEDKTVDRALAELHGYGATNLRAIRRKHPGPPAPFWIDRLGRPRFRDRLLRAAMNPLSDVAARAVVRCGPFALQRRALDYLVLRNVWRGYEEGAT